MTNYQAFRKRIDDAKPRDLDRLTRSLDRLYLAGVFSVSEFQRLDGHMMDKFTPEN